MDTPRKNNDCYFYYYSTCLKGDGCTFRHEPAALGSETVCTYWAQGNCINQPCNFRHMELKKNRKTIPCYWETQPSGCQKSHCSFQHKNQREGVARDSDQTNNCDGVGAVKPLERPDYRQRRSLPGDGGEVSDGDGSRRLNQEYNSAPVDPMVVNFEEESDNESVPTMSPTKNVVNRTKTLEEISLERIQAESAAFYHYEDQVLPQRDIHSGPDADFHVMTLAEIRAQTNKNIPSREDDDESDAELEQGSRKRKMIKQKPVYKKRAHSPIKFDISQAEPNVNNYRVVSSVEPKINTAQTSDERSSNKLSPVTASQPAVKLCRPVSLAAKRPIRLNRTFRGSHNAIQTQSNGSKSNTTIDNKSKSDGAAQSTANGVNVTQSSNISSNTRNNEITFLTREHDFTAETFSLTKVTSTDSSLIDGADFDNTRIESNVRQRGDSIDIDEEMLLEDTTLQPDEDILIEDIDALLDD